MLVPIGIQTKRQFFAGILSGATKIEKQIHASHPWRELSITNPVSK
jgi:hypothetical protein